MQVGTASLAQRAHEKALEAQEASTGTSKVRKERKEEKKEGGGAVDVSEKNMEAVRSRYEGVQKVVTASEEQAKEMLQEARKYVSFPDRISFPLRPRKLFL